MVDPFIGEISMVPYNFAPQDWAFCSGQILSVNTNPALYSLLGGYFGGDGRTTFGLPDLRGRVPMGSNTMGYSPVFPQQYTPNLGQLGGTPAITLNALNLPPHSHSATVTGASPIVVTINASSAAGTESVPGTNGATTLAASMAGRTAGSTIYNNQAPTVAMNAGTATVTGGASAVSIGTTGNGNAFDNRNPYQGINFIIALQGIYPQRP